MGYSYNHGLVTPMKGASIVACTVTGLDASDGDDCTIADQGSSGQLASVEHDATGVYIVKFAAPYPTRVIAGFSQIQHATGTTDLLHARLDAAGYDEDTGWLTINVSNDDDSGAPVAANGGATDELHLFLVTARYTAI